ncbi:TetR/AcrR family transcriptional regulator [Sphingomonas sp. A2-49]|uniref:TetR/AcrR family transcriptional regulator n=1 Tax=Sphingomonas sp. A2-49 TaxID=1391375 RepID=UPI0021D2AE76|nr:TetR/AcrR family transcriptional regulator [Sphingomonas sp. A2-49]MCU6453134.1 TetR/AcrR family transcriptional regulator [Sphingomonas sp. A2-49]
MDVLTVTANGDAALRAGLPGTTGRPAKRQRKPDSRAIATKSRIFEATTRVMLRAGVDGMSIQTIVAEAGVARGTLYRYFSSKEELLDAYTGYMRERFDAALQAAILPHTAPAARLEAFLGFFDEYLNSDQARRFLETEPQFALGYFRRSFDDGVSKVRDALDPVFDHWSRQLGRQLDRRLLAEFIMRVLISNVLVPVSHGHKGLAGKLMELAKHVG